MSALMNNPNTESLATARSLREALRMVAHGYYLTPVTINRTAGGDKIATFHARWKRDPNGYTIDQEQIRDWSAQFACSFAVVCGPSGVEGVDLDMKPGLDIDAVTWWATQGLPLGMLVVETPSGGLHTYWRRSTGRTLPTSASEVAPGVDTRSVGGVFFAPGSFVLSLDGSPEPTGYTIQGALPKVIDLSPTPNVVLDAWAVRKTEPASPPPSGTPDLRRPFTEDQAAEYVREKALGKLRAAQEGHRNKELNDAAYLLGHFVPHFYDEEGATTALREVAEEIGLDSREIGPTIQSGLHKGMSEPYAKVDNPFTSASGNSREDDPGADPFEIAVEAAVHRLKVDEAARRRIADEHNAARPRIADGLIDDLEIVPEPDMLLGSLIPEGGVGFIGGKSGSYKTFLATSWACCIATGRPWLGRPEFSVRRARKVLYVAAEGMRGAAARLRSWETANETSRRGLLTLYPRPVHLGDPSQLDELAAVIEERGYEFVVIDTYHRSAPTADENSTKDFGVIFEAAARLRDDYGCGVLFVDHTGHAGERLRGTSGKGDDADYVLISTYPGVDRSVSVQRELQVFKLKDEDSSDRWTIRLEPVEGHTMPVVQIGEAQTVNPFRATGEWWHPENLPEVPPEVVQKIETAAAPVSGRGVDAARWVWRYLKAMDDEQGHTRAQIKQALASIDRSEKFTPAAVDKAIPLLDKSGLVGRDKTRIWLEP